MLAEDFLLQVDLCQEVISRLPTRRSVDQKGHSSYRWKHIVEGKLREEGRPHYVSNGAFIAAALLQGLEVERLNGGPNARFNIFRRYRRILGTRCLAPSADDETSVGAPTRSNSCARGHLCRRFRLSWATPAWP